MGMSLTSTLGVKDKVTRSKNHPEGRVVHIMYILSKNKQVGSRQRQVTFFYLSIVARIMFGVSLVIQYASALVNNIP